MTSKLAERHEQIVAAIRSSSPHPVVAIPLRRPHTARIDLSLNNPLVAQTDCTNNREVTALLNTLLTESGTPVGIGGYNEKRGWYARGEQFSQGEEIRSIHLGVDIWAPAETPVFAPYDATIHSLQDNALFGDYGPTIILTHTVSGQSFHTLYGHLSRESLHNKAPGMTIQRGEELGRFGAPPINGDWPPHLHFQIIIDMLDKRGDYPGVAAESQREYFLALCPDPNLILRSAELAL